MAVSLERLSDWLDEEWFENVANASPAFGDEASPKYWAYKGYANWKLSLYSQAAEDFSKAIAMHPQAENTLFLRGRCYEELEQYGEAVDDYEAVLLLNWRTADAHAHKGFCLEMMGEFNAALQSYLAALEIDPDETLALAGVKSLGPAN